MGRIFDPKHLQMLEATDRFEWQNPESVADLLRLDGSERVVDFGCGTGYNSVPIAKRLKTGELAAVDISEEMLRFLKDKLSGLDLPIRLIKFNDKVPLPDGWADRILAVNVLHELTDQPGAPREIARLLDMKGKLVVIDWRSIDRPVGPPKTECLSIDEATEFLRPFGLEAAERSDVFPYHFVLYFTKGEKNERERR